MKFEWKGKSYYIDKTLSYQLMSLAYNVKSDWDFVILITGNRMVRVGKSVLGMTVSAYLAYLFDRFKLNKDAYTIKNVFFDNKVMMDDAQKVAKHSILQYDEGREGLAASKAMKSFQQDLVDFFTECGQLNHIFVIVAPDFFELKEDIAVARSELLINVYRKSDSKMRNVFRDGEMYPITRFDRGYFQFFSRKTKAKLYDKYKTTGRKSYALAKADFIGRFTDQYCLDEKEYKQLKKDSLSRFKERHEEEKEKKSKTDVIRDKIVIGCHTKGLSGTAIVKKLAEEYDYEVSPRTINRIIQQFNAETKIDGVDSTKPPIRGDVGLKQPSQGTSTIKDLPKPQFEMPK